MADVIKAQKQNDKWKILVLDRLSTRILSRQGVYFILNILYYDFNLLLERFLTGI